MKQTLQALQAEAKHFDQVKKSQLSTNPSFNRISQASLVDFRVFLKPEILKIAPNSDTHAIIDDYFARELWDRDNCKVYIVDFKCKEKNVPPASFNRGWEWFKKRFLKL